MLVFCAILFSHTILRHPTYAKEYQEIQVAFSEYPRGVLLPQPLPARPPPIAHPIPHPINLLIYHDDGIRRRSLSTDTPRIINNNQNDHVYAVFRK